MEIQQRKLTGRQLNQQSPIPGRRRRRGFTLLELLVAIVVISILASFILPAITGVFGTAKNAAVSNEISQMESAIATFKQKYGIEPPSAITLYETEAGWNGDLSGSKALIQRMWPNFDIKIPRDFNDPPDGSSQNFPLKGSECLVFFLGGIQSNGALAGFSKNPANPFAAPTSGEVREGPFFEFVPSRLHPSPTTTNAPAKVYFDPLGGQQRPYVYLSSYDGRGYQASDIPTTLSPTILFTNPNDGPLLDAFVTSSAAGAPKHKAKTFQIISPGADGAYSTAGGSVIYDVSAANSGLGTNKYAYDNITNFSGGKLRP